ncbi:hypothetical protein QBC44DRAFT_232889 [Cladorrhinum sp. PSN332]|nr:hypothetical protein QBC44DRAFT_232889 [Cladorrhinum sp. PSN332]
MHFSTALVALLSASVLAAPKELAASKESGPVGIPAKLIDNVPESIANATALGIDVYGSIPDDAVQKGEGYYVAEPGTLGWAWIRAQQDLEEYEHGLEARGLPVRADAIEKRQSTGIRVNAYTGDWCSGSAYFFTNPNYWWFYNPTDNVYWYSFGFSTRTLRSNEKIEFWSGPWGGNRCSTHHTNIWGPTGAGSCWQIQASTCFSLTLP